MFDRHIVLCVMCTVVMCTVAVDTVVMCTVVMGTVVMGAVVMCIAQNLGVTGWCTILHGLQ